MSLLLRSKDPEEKELFYAVLGGSPGNIGILLSLVLRQVLAVAEPTHPRRPALCAG
jgi:hypothetical protein